MVTDKETKVIDPEFAFYGPMALDTGMYFSNLWMAYFSQHGHEENGSREAMRQWLFATIVEAWAVFREEFSRLWREERNGILYQRALFEDQGDWLGAEQALDHFLADLWADTLGFAGVEMHRRILGLAHNADFETIEDAGLRARCETSALELGRHLAVNRRHIHSIEEVNALAVRIDKASHA
jgi:5-methylthioribose kinase